VTRLRRIVMYHKASKPFAIATLLLFCNVVFSSGKLGRTGASSSASSDDEVQVRQVLADVGAKNGVTFTIEEALLKGGAMDRIRSFRHRTLPDGTGLKAVLDDLSQSVPNFTWHNDTSNPKVIHIVDDHLLRRQGYPLDRVIDEIDFSGTVLELVDAIAAKEIPVSATGPVGTDDLLSMDGVTRIQVKGKGLRVRDALSDFVPLDGRGPILWTAETHVDGSDQTTYIRYRGAPPRSSTPKQ
jgi:hypothetical protein